MWGPFDNPLSQFERGLSNSQIKLQTLVVKLHVTVNEVQRDKNKLVGENAALLEELSPVEHS